MVLLCTARPELLERRPEWGGGSATPSPPLLEPLSMDDSVDPGRPTSWATARWIPRSATALAEAGGGNPLFLQEYVAMLLEEGALRETGTAGCCLGPGTRVSTPPTLAALLAARLDRLPPDERAVLLHASVIGKVFSIGELEALLPVGARPRSGRRPRPPLRPRADPSRPRGGARRRAVRVHAPAGSRLGVRDAAEGDARRPARTLRRLAGDEPGPARRGVPGDRGLPPRAGPPLPA